MTKYPLMIVGLMLALLALPNISLMAQEKPTASDDPIGYFLGLSVGQQMASQGFKAGDFDVNVVAVGLADALAGKDPALSDEQLGQVQAKIQSLLQKRQQEQAAEQTKAATMNKEKSELWLQQNKQKEGVKTLEGGVQYSVIEEGDGPSPSAEDTVRVHYTGKLINGKVFDSSVERGEPATFRVNQVIKGWQQALQQMEVGDKWKLYIPPELAYGERGVAGPGGEPAIGPNEVLIFDVELLGIE